jgi:hypothetical protein
MNVERMMPVIIRMGNRVMAISSRCGGGASRSYDPAAPER